MTHEQMRSYNTSNICLVTMKSTTMLLKKLTREQRFSVQSHLTEICSTLLCLCVSWVNLFMCLLGECVCWDNIMCVLNQHYFLHLVIGSHPFYPDLSHLGLKHLFKKSNWNNSIENLLRDSKVIFFQTKRVLSKQCMNENKE